MVFKGGYCSLSIQRDRCIIYWFIYIYQHGRLIFHSFHVGLCRYRDLQGGPLPVTRVTGVINLLIVT